MKKSFLSSVLTLILLISGGANTLYANTHSTANLDILLLKKLEQFFVKEKQQHDRVKMGRLAVYQDVIVQTMEQHHPNYSKIINLGKVPYALADCSAAEKPGTPANSAKHYLLEVQEDNDSFYYGVSVVSALRAPSDVIPAHTSQVFIFVKAVGERELIEALKVLQK